MTMTQKILAARAGLPFVKPGQLIECGLDLALGNDITAPVAISVFRETGAATVFDKDKVCLVLDHFTPNKDIQSAELCRVCRDFATVHGLTHFYDVGEMGIEHCLIPEKGLALPGNVIIGADSHTCTYGALGAFATGVGSTDLACGFALGTAWFKVPDAIRFILKNRPAKWVGGKDIILHIIGKIGVDGALYKSMEFCGDGLNHLSMDDRFTISNMAIEAGAKNGIFPVDEKTREYLAKTAPGKKFTSFEPGDESDYTETHTIDLSLLKPTVALPHLPENTKTTDEIDDIKIDQVIIGSCTNGRMEDLRTAASILAGRKGIKAAKGVRVLIFPGTQAIYLQALREGLIEDFILAGAAVSTPTCGPCLGGHMGVLAKGEKAVSTTNRNFVGRMGHPESEVYLASPAVAAASAVAGRITGPQNED
jgi:3-isopropylmalate/(R)-2-methylmalate dehydratase large subunit